MNKNYFEIIDSEIKAYLLGYLVADGNISKKTNRICFCINKNDKSILELFKKELNSENLVRDYTTFDKRTKKYYYSSVFQVSSKKIKEDLKNLGVCENKSMLFKNVNIPKELFRHFLRGMMDGDGSISKDKCNLISSKEFLEYLNYNYFNNKIYLEEMTKNLNTWKLHLQSYSTILDFLNYIYKDSTVYLDRKYQKYLQFKNKEIKTRKETKFLINE
jgi:hypothetical protein